MTRTRYELHGQGRKAKLTSLMQDNQVIFASPRYGVGLPSPTYYGDKDTVDDYKSALSQVLKAVLPSPAARNAVDKLAAAVVELESKIAAATPPLEDLQDGTVGYYIIDMLAQMQLANRCYRRATILCRSRIRQH